MNILITSSYRTDSETGTSQVAKLLSKKLSQKHKVLYLCLGSKNSTQKINRNLVYRKISSINMGRATFPIITPFLEEKLYQEIEKFSPDVIHAQNSIFTSKLVQNYAENNNVPFIVTFHHVPTEPIQHLLPNISKNKVAKLAQEFYSQISLKSFLSKSDAVIALNQTIKNSIREVDKKIKVKIINNGVDLDYIHGIKKRKVKKEVINFFALGSYSERKNQEYLLKVFSYLPPNFKLSCFGNKKTGREYYLKLELLKAKLNLKNVFLSGYIKNGELLKIISNYNYFVSASLKEAQSLAVIYSLALGKPIISLENETTKEFTNRSVGIVLPQKTTPKVFAKSLEKYVRSVDYHKTSQKCTSESKKFDIKKTLKEIEEFYKQVISGKKNTSKSRGLR